MSKMDNVERTGKPFEWMKILIHTIGLPIVQMINYLNGFGNFNFKAFILMIEIGDYFNFLSK